MTRQRRPGSLGALVVAGLVACASPARNASADAADELHGALYEQFLAAMERDEALSLATRKDPDLPGNLETFIAFERPRSNDAALSARVVRARGDSVFTQISRLLSTRKELSLADLDRLLALDDFTLTEARCPSLRPVWEELTREPWSFDLAPQFPEVLEIPIHPRTFTLAGAMENGPSLRIECQVSTPQCDRLRRAYALIAPCLEERPAP